MKDQNQNADSESIDPLEEVEAYIKIDDREFTVNIKFRKYVELTEHLREETKKLKALPITSLRVDNINQEIEIETFYTKDFRNVIQGTSVADPNKLKIDEELVEYIENYIGKDLSEIEEEKPYKFSKGDILVAKDRTHVKNKYGIDAEKLEVKEVYKKDSITKEDKEEQIYYALEPKLHYKHTYRNYSKDLVHSNFDLAEEQN